MEMIRLAINGFGRIGRSIFRVAMQRKNFEILALNDINDWQILSYLLAHDSTHGNLPNPPTYEDNTLLLQDQPPIKLSNHAKIEDLGFGALGADIVIESTGKFLESTSLNHHIHNGAKKVILSSPPIDSMPTFIMGVNHRTYDGQALLSNASCTANAIAPIAQVIDQALGIESATFCITHSYTNEQSLLDSVYAGDKRRSRAAAQNIIPTHTASVSILERILPALKGKIAGHSVRVPVSNVLLLDLSITLRSPTSTQELNTLLIESAQDHYQGIIGIDHEECVSSDFIGNPQSVIIAPDLCYVLNGRNARILAWCDNEWGYANRVLDLAEHILS